MNQINIGKFIAEKRKEKGYTQQQLADMLMVTNRSVSRWENGINMPDLSLLEPLCDILDITLTELFQGGSNMEDNKEETIKDVVQYSGKVITEKKKTIRIILIAAAILLSFGAGYYLNQYLSWRKPLTIYDYDQPFAFLTREDIVRMTLYSNDSSNKVRFSKEDSYKVLNQLRMLQTEKLIPASTDYSLMFNDYMKVVTRKGSFTFRVSPQYLEFDNRYYISPYNSGTASGHIMNYLNFADVVNSYVNNNTEVFNISEFENLDDSNGLILAIWKTIGAEVRCGLFTRDCDQIGSVVISLHRGIPVELMRTVVKNYDPDKIEIQLVQNMISSNIDSYWKDTDDPELISYFHDIIFD